VLLEDDKDSPLNRGVATPNVKNNNRRNGYVTNMPKRLKEPAFTTPIRLNPTGDG
jgi:hypothetical protein